MSTKEIKNPEKKVSNPPAPDPYAPRGKNEELAPQENFKPTVGEEIDAIPDAPDYDTLNVKMAGDRFLFQDLPMKSKVGTLHLPQMGDIGVNKARVVAVGDEVKQTKVGDIVFKVAELGEYLMTNQGQFRFLPENAIIAYDVKFDGEATPIMKLDQAGV